MVRQKFALSFVSILLFLSVVAPGAGASVFDWQVYESDNFVIFYQEGYKYQAEEVLYYLETYRQETMDLVGNEEFKTLVILQDGGLDSNGAATGANRKINILTNNPSTLSRMEGSEGYNSWFKQVAIHEFTHLAQINNSSGSVTELVKLGGVYSANLYTPTWLKEGIAVYNESRFSPYAGRLNNGYYDSFMAAKVKSGQLPDLVELPYGENEYIFGAKFIDYLAKTYGEEKLTAYFQEQGSNLWAYPGVLFPKVGIDRSANQVFGKSFPKLYADWKAYEQDKFKDWDQNAQLIVANNEGKISKLTKY